MSIELPRPPGGYGLAAGWVALALAGAVALLLAYWTLWDAQRPATLRGEFVRWDGEGEVAVVRVTGERREACAGLARRYMVNGVIAALPSREIHPWTDPVGPADYEIAVPVPRYLHLPATLRVVHEYECNPGQRILPVRVILDDIPIPERPHGTR